MLAANKLSDLSNILFLAQNYCKKYGVTLCHDKTKLLMVSKVDKVSLEVYNPICIDNHNIDFSEQAEHVGVIRAKDGNMPHILGRISAHRKALRSILSAGIAQNTRVNPVVALRLESVYGLSVLLSGVGCLALSGVEIATIDKHVKDTHQNIQKLHQKTPRSVVHFLGGNLPGTAAIHLRILSLFGMVARLSGDPLQTHAENVLKHSKSSSKSWFWLVRDICLMYGLPQPLMILKTPLTKEKFKKLVKSKVVDYWELRLRGESSLLSSLKYFKPEYMSLTKPHPLWSSAGSNPHEISKAIQQARFLSGRYRSMELTKHWSGTAKDGFCLSSTCINQPETTEHILIHCGAYLNCKRRLYSLWLSTKKQFCFEASPRSTFK